MCTCVVRDRVHVSRYAYLDGMPDIGRYAPNIRIGCTTLQHTATHCNMPDIRRYAPNIRSLIHTHSHYTHTGYTHSPCYRTLCVYTFIYVCTRHVCRAHTRRAGSVHDWADALGSSLVLLCVATCCSVLQSAAVCCIV